MSSFLISSASRTSDTRLLTAINDALAAGGHQHRVGLLPSSGDDTQIACLPQPAWEKLSKLFGGGLGRLSPP